MKDIRDYVDYAVEKAVEILAIPSPSGYTSEAIEKLKEIFSAMDYPFTQTIKGGLIIDLGGKDSKDSVLLQSHVDTLGGMVAEIKSDGRLRIVPLGGMNANNAEAENCYVVTKFSGKIEGTFQLINASIHVNDKYSKTLRKFDGMEVVLDADVEDKEDAEALGISAGDYVCFEPRTRVTESGYIKSRFLDDKLSVGVLIAYAKFLKEQGVVPARKVFLHFTVFEEVGHGAAATVPEGVTEAICVDMGCVGEGLTCTEKMVSICAKDSSGPYHYDVVKGLEEAAIKAKIDYAVDIYPDYYSDVQSTLDAGFDIKHGCIGAGVYASHGYERSHKDGVKNTLALLDSYLD
ncbi:MAG: M42 family peptidase [Clostridia bacterium]|nr:M42 family peptidase [Clostridia bacterium]